MLHAYDRAGWDANLSTFFHNVSGRVIIEDADTIRVENFYYDGQGPAVYFYLAEQNTNESFKNGLAIGSLLTRPTAYNNETLTIDLPAGNTLDGYHAISVWCAAVSVNFGSGLFGVNAEYTVTFDATWSAQTHTYFPPSPHFSGLIGLTHTPQTSIWRLGDLASNGIESMAETGSKSALIADMTPLFNSGNAFSTLSGGGINPSPGSVSLNFNIHSAFPNVSLVSMIAPSPDWFVGVDSLSLFQDGQWLPEVVVPLWPYDSGTDSGPDFTSPNNDTNPPQPITQITGYPFTGDPTLGTFTFTLTCSGTAPADLNNDCRVDILFLNESVQKLHKPLGSVR